MGLLDVLNGMQNGSRGHGEQDLTGKLEGGLSTGVLAYGGGDAFAARTLQTRPFAK